MKNILLTTDLSEQSKAAFPVAREMAKTFGAKLTLLLVGHELVAIPTAFGHEAPIYFDPSVQKEIDRRLKGDLEKLGAEEFPDGGVDVLLKNGALSPVDGILEVAKTLKADLLIMSSHGRTGIERVLIGSVAERVVREAPCPVLVVPASART